MWHYESKPAHDLLQSYNVFVQFSQKLPHTRFQLYPLETMQKVIWLHSLIKSKKPLCLWFYFVKSSSLDIFWCLNSYCLYIFSLHFVYFCRLITTKTTFIFASTAPGFSFLDFIVLNDDIYIIFDPRASATR